MSYIIHKVFGTGPKTNIPFDLPSSLRCYWLCSLIYRDQRYQRKIIFLSVRAVFNSGKRVMIALSVNILDLINDSTMIHTSSFWP